MSTCPGLAKASRAQMAVQPSFQGNVNKQNPKTIQRTTDPNALNQNHTQIFNTGQHNLGPGLGSGPPEWAILS
jgi:hypothetical protein